MQDPQWRQCIPLTLDPAAAFTSNSTSASIHNLVRHSATLETDTFPPESTSTSTSTSLSTISCDSINTIESWLDDIYEAEPTALSVQKYHQGPKLAQKPDVRGTRKRKRSSSPSSDEESAPSSLSKRSRHILQPTTTHAMPPFAADDAAGANPRPPTPSNSSSSQAADFSTPTHSTSIKFRVPTDAGWVGDSLAEHGLRCEYGALKRYPEFEKKIMQIVNGDRWSQMKSKSLRGIQKISQICERMNEATFMGSLLPLIIKVDRTVEIDVNNATAQELKLIEDGNSVEVAKPTPGMVYASKEWFDDGVFAVMDQDFRHDLLPHRYIDQQLAAAMRKDDSMLTPRPDRCYGLVTDLIPTPEDARLNPELRALIQACPNLSHSFFIIEGKSNRGMKIEAENQARRGGASLVNAMRQLLAKIGEPYMTRDGVDDRNFIFSATLSPGLIGIWVHWVELINGRHTFHMSRLTSLASDNEHQIPEIRKIINNIMSWGCDLKARRLQELHEKVYAWQSKETARLQEEAQQKDAEKKANRKRQRT